jgi:integrase
MVFRARQRLRSHYPDQPHDDLPAFVADLRDKEAMAALAWELCILTATRAGEVLNAQ